MPAVQDDEALIIVNIPTNEEASENHMNKDILLVDLEDKPKDKSLKIEHEETRGRNKCLKMMIQLFDPFC